jgi:hypothetical protein
MRQKHRAHPTASEFTDDLIRADATTERRISVDGWGRVIRIVDEGRRFEKFVGVVMQAEQLFNLCSQSRVAITGFGKKAFPRFWRKVKRRVEEVFNVL